jgi:3-mercaptopyruvate sulfurtransferase SseA
VNERTSARVAAQLMAAGAGRVYALEGGWEAWLKAGHPTEPK